MIKPLPGVKKVLHSLIYPRIKEGDCSNVCKCVAPHCENGISDIQSVDFDQSYSPVAHADSFITNIDIMYMRRITARILDVNNYFQNKKFSIHERVCVITPPYYLDWFENLTPLPTTELT